MKKTLLMLVAAMFCLVGLNGCGSDKDEPVATATAHYEVTFSSDVREATETIVIFYKGDDNENKIATLDRTQTSWTKDVTSTKASAEFGYRIVVSAKGVSELTKDSYDFSATGSIKIVRGNNEMNNMLAYYYKQENNASVSESVAKADVSRKLVANLNKAVGYTVNREGASTRNDGLNFGNN
ncbi:MAG: hypothetical protein IJU62_08960 [Muribaculaceae bacterium]|nr:hypothetical protein [Muribaculaceae bacterium]